MTTASLLNDNAYVSLKQFNFVISVIFCLNAALEASSPFVLKVSYICNRLLFAKTCSLKWREPKVDKCWLTKLEDVEFMFYFRYDVIWTVTISEKLQFLEQIFLWQWHCRLKISEFNIYMKIFRSSLMKLGTSTLWIGNRTGTGDFTTLWVR